MARSWKGVRTKCCPESRGRLQMTLEREMRKEDEKKKRDWFLRPLASVSFAYPCDEITCLHLLIAPMLSLALPSTPSAVFHCWLHWCAPILCRSRSLVSSISDGQVNQSVKERAAVQWKDVVTETSDFLSPFWVEHREASCLVVLESCRGVRKEVAWEVSWEWDHFNTALVLKMLLQRRYMN